MAPKLYCFEASSPVRSVLLTAKALDLELDLKCVNLFNAEHLTEDYIKINPQHTVPTLDDNGYILWDSHAIAAYLVSKYGKDDSLYPKDLQKRGVVDQRLHFNSNVIQPRMGAIIGPIVRQGEKSIAQEKKDNIEAAYDLLEIFLENNDYLAANHLTVADFCIISHISTLSAFVPITQNKHPRLAQWKLRMEDLPYYVEANQVGNDKLVGYVETKLSG